MTRPYCARSPEERREAEGVPRSSGMRSGGDGA